MGQRVESREGKTSIGTGIGIGGPIFLMRRKKCNFHCVESTHWIYQRYERTFGKEKIRTSAKSRSSMERKKERYESGFRFNKL